LLRDIFVATALQFAPLQIGIMSMTIAGPAHWADKCCEATRTRLRLADRALSIPKRLAVSIVFCATAVAGCAQSPAHLEFAPVQHEVRAVPVRTAAHARRHTEPQEPIRSAELRIQRPDPSLLAPQPPPDCDFKRTGVSAVDPGEWARLKLDYERQCYLDAEKIARERLRLLQASSTCEIEPVGNRRPAR
jgi:hypothetical protein